jgi:hypothetical protein
VDVAQFVTCVEQIYSHTTPFTRTFFRKINSASEVLRASLGPYGIFVNAVASGPTRQVSTTSCYNLKWTTKIVLFPISRNFPPNKGLATYERCQTAGSVEFPNSVVFGPS